MKYFLILIAFMISYGSSTSRPFRVDQIPNGTKLQCLNCHNSSSGGSLNSFGQEVFSNHLTSKNSFGNVVWSNDLAGLDSDKDGFTNGQELQDSNGDWKVGLSDPGDRNLVTNPGNSSSFPTSIREYLSNTNSGLLQVASIAPNPITESFKLTINSKKDSFVNISIFDVNGKTVMNIPQSYFPAGQHQINVNVDEHLNYSLVSGNYYLMVYTADSFDIKNIKICR